MSSSKAEFPKPVHPGAILEDMLHDYGVTQTQAARDMGVPANRFSQIINGQRAITANTALRLARYFGTSAEFWMNLQSQYWLGLERPELADFLETIPVKGKGRLLMPLARKWITTNEDWFPAYYRPNNPIDPTEIYPYWGDRDQGGYLVVRASQLSDGSYRCSVWGADDYGLEYDSPDEATVLTLFDRIQDGTSKARLQSWGFIHG